MPRRPKGGPIPLEDIAMTIRVFITGGTFDKAYDELSGELFFTDSHLPEMLRLGRSLLKVETRTLMLVDSLDMSDADRQIIVENCRGCAHEQIVITHGTDNMEVTARLLGQADLKKTIVLTGAMRPYEFGSSDGLFNLGAALAFAQCLPHGVYVAMNGRFLPYDDVRKNKKTGTFEPLSD
jgi:L-asparaginase